MKQVLKLIGLSALTITAISSGVMADQTKKTIRKQYWKGKTMPELIIMGLSGASTKVDMTGKTTDELMDIVKDSVKKWLLTERQHKKIITG